MILPTMIITFVLSFPLSNGLCCGGQTMEGGLYGCKSVVACTYERNSILYNSDSVSDNDPDLGDDNSTYEGVTEENFNSKMEYFQAILENVETHEIEEISLLSRIFEILTYLTGFCLFIVLVLLLRYIYKFFKMFF